MLHSTEHRRQVEARYTINLKLKFEIRSVSVEPLFLGIMYIMYICGVMHCNNEQREELAYKGNKNQQKSDNLKNDYEEIYSLHAVVANQSLNTSV